MEGPFEEDSIPESNVIPKVTRVVSSASVAPGQIIKTANGQTVVLSSVVSSASSSVPSDSNSQHSDNTVPTVAQTIAVSAGMSIVHFQLPNQSNMVQSVIQPNHQSVIQATNPGSISALQLPKNVILLNKVGQGSVIQSTESDSSIQVAKEENEAVNQAMYEDDSKRRREILARRPSYRKILNDLSATEAATNSGMDSKSEDESDSTPPTISLPNYLKVLPSQIQLGNPQDTSTGAPTIQGIPTIMTNSNSSSSTIVQYATSGPDGQFIVPADLQAYQIRPPNPSAIAQNVVMTSPSLSSHIIDEASKKRELRLLKNREAAKECRRKKKEYIKCLENRVAVLENQNKALIDELKTLKELYCKKSE